MNEIKKYKCGKSTFILKEGDILKSQAEVIVSSDNVGLQMGAGVSHAIHQAAGVSLDLDLDKVSHVELGDVVVTTAGELPQRYIFHCISDKRSSSRNIDIIPTIINRSLLKCLKLMPMLDVYSIALPAIGTGAVGLPMEVIAQSTLKVLKDHLNQTNHNLTIELYAWGIENFNIWDKEIREFPDFVLIDDESSAVSSQPEHGLDVFISYSWKDQEIALAIDQWLTKLNINHFLDRNNLIGGQDHK